jgi:hypothetical protein
MKPVRVAWIAEGQVTEADEMVVVEKQKIN